MTRNITVLAAILHFACGSASTRFFAPDVPPQDLASSESGSDAPSEIRGEDSTADPEASRRDPFDGDSAEDLDSPIAPDPGGDVPPFVDEGPSQPDRVVAEEVSPGDVFEILGPILEGLTLEFPGGDVYPWGSEIPYKAYLTYSDGSKEPVVFPDLSVETTYEHVLRVDEVGRVWGVGPGTGMVLVRFIAESQTFSASGKVQVHDFAGEPPPGDRCEEAMDATGGLWVPVNLAVAWDDGDPPEGCGSPLVPHSGPEVHFRLAPVSPTVYRVVVHPAAAVDAMISVVDDCGDAAQCLVSVNEAGEGKDEVVETTVPAGETRVLVIEGARGEAGWFNVTIQATGVEPAG